MHVLIGAPPLTPVSDAAEGEPGQSGQWRTMELCWQGGGAAQPREDEGRIHGIDGRDWVDASSEPGEVPSTSKHGTRLQGPETQTGSPLEREPGCPGPFGELTCPE